MNAHTVTWYIGMTITILVVLWMFYLVLWPASLWPKKQAETKEGDASRLGQANV